jgi:hypothetical protein
MLPCHAYDKHDSATPTERTGSVAELRQATARLEFALDNRFYRDDHLPGEGVFVLRRNHQLTNEARPIMPYLA